MAHEPDPQGRPCIACTDPDAYAAWQATQRSHADQYSRWAETLRAAGEVMKERSVWAAVRGEDGADYAILNVRLCGDANALAMRANSIWHHLEAVAAGHTEPVQTTLPA
jgi:gamma-glutamyl:cysteine ligase YbdK (ATP-grasp superfamily)